MNGLTGLRLSGHISSRLVAMTGDLSLDETPQGTFYIDETIQLNVVLNGNNKNEKSLLRHNMHALLMHSDDELHLKPTINGSVAL